MNYQDQAAFVTSLCNSIRDELLGKIAAGKTPDTWDGIELRALLAEKFVRETWYLDRPDNRKRRKAYRNDVIVNNL